MPGREGVPFQQRETTPLPGSSLSGELGGVRRHLADLSPQRENLPQQAGRIGMLCGRPSWSTLFLDWACFSSRPNCSTVFSNWACFSGRPKRSACILFEGTRQLPFGSGIRLSFPLEQGTSTLLEVSALLLTKYLPSFIISLFRRYF